MKENSVVMETNVYLVKEKSGLEKESHKLYQELNTEKDVHGRNKLETADLLKKVGGITTP